MKTRIYFHVRQMSHFLHILQYKHKCNITQLLSVLNFNLIPSSKWHDSPCPLLLNVSTYLIRKLWAIELRPIKWLHSCSETQCQNVGVFFFSRKTKIFSTCAVPGSKRASINRCIFWSASVRERRAPRMKMGEVNGVCPAALMSMTPGTHVSLGDSCHSP